MDREARRNGRRGADVTFFGAWSFRDLARRCRSAALPGGKCMERPWVLTLDAQIRMCVFAPCRWDDLLVVFERQTSAFSKKSRTTRRIQETLSSTTETGGGSCFESQHRLYWDSAACSFGSSELPSSRCCSHFSAPPPPLARHGRLLQGGLRCSLPERHERLDRP